MTRILFTSQPGSGHWHPLVPLARALESAAHEVAFASTPDVCTAIEAKGFHCFRAGVDDSEQELLERNEQRATRAPAEQAEYMQTYVFAGVRAERSLPDLLDIVREWRPALVVRENTEFSGCLAAEHAGIPHAVVQITAFRANLPLLVDAPLNRLRASIGLPPDKPADMLYRYLSLSSRPPSLWNPKVPMPATMHHFRYAGFNESGQEELPPWTAHLLERPTVFATLGTVFNYRTDIFSAILEGLQEEPINLILAIGRDRDPLEFGEQPEHVRVERYIPQDLLLPRCDLVVTHGGSGTTMDALSHGLPMVMVPIGADQPRNAEVCAQAGVARVVTADGRTGTELSQAIRAATQDVLQDPRYRENAQRLRHEIEELPGLEYPVALLERLIRERTPLLSHPPRG